MRHLFPYETGELKHWFKSNKIVYCLKQTPLIKLLYFLNIFDETSTLIFKSILLLFL